MNYQGLILWLTGLSEADKTVFEAAIKAIAFTIYPS